MILCTLNYEYTEYVRRPTCGGMDSEFSHTQKSYGTFGMVVPDDGWGKLHPDWENYVRGYHKKRYTNDPLYNVMFVTSTKVDAIYQPPITMIGR